MCVRVRTRELRTLWHAFGQRNRINYNEILLLEPRTLFKPHFVK